MKKIDDTTEYIEKNKSPFYLWPTPGGNNCHSGSIIVLQSYFHVITKILIDTVFNDQKEVEHIDSFNFEYLFCTWQEQNICVTHIKLLRLTNAN